MPATARILILLILFNTALTSAAQKLVSKKSNVAFFSDAILEDIAAKSTKSRGIIDTFRKEFAFTLPIRSFQFEKSLMKEHFNEKYMESDKFPNATFTGTMQKFDVNAATQELLAEGTLTIHGVPRQVTIPATIRKKGATFLVNARFMVVLADYNIAIPQVLFQNIAEEVEVTVNFEFVPQ